jgi:hypothetical protein
MKTSKHHTRIRRHSHRPLLIATLAVGGFLQFVSPLLADGTPAGTQISNTATATYEDPNQPGTPINTTSNTVSVTVAEVAGVTVTPLATTDVNGGTVLPDDVINYDYKVTNVGNDTTQIFVPGTATVTGPGAQQAVKIIGYIDPNGVTTSFPLASQITVPAAGGTTTDLGVTIGANPVGVVPQGFSLIVEVPVQVNTLAPSGAPIAVQLGSTTADGSGSTQNQPDTADGSTADEVRTIDVTTETGGAALPPSNGEREASAVQQVLVGSQPQAFAAILKNRANYTTSGTPELDDDILTYGLSMKVNATAPAGSTGLSPANLIGTEINVDGADVTKVLVSDAVPSGTVLTGTPTSATGWTTVYTNTAVGTPANDATWVTDPAAIGGIANATRIGFINDGPIAAGTTVNGFTFQVLTSGVTTTTTIANVAQLFGQTEGGSPDSNGNPVLVYDESGDETPSNFNDNGTPGSNTPTDGVADPATDGVDSGNNNTGTGPDGEDNVFTLAAPGSILNGPNGRADAVGPNDNNDDFTNQSVAISPNIAPGSLSDPGNVTFTNTITNPSTTDPLVGVLLVPDDGAATATLPAATTVTLTYGGRTATYTYNGTDFIFSSGNTIIIPTLAPGESVNYTTVVNLPDNTPLSTDLATPLGDLPSFPVPIYAFVDTNGNGRPDAPETTQNATIDRVYNGFLQMVKDARILDASGNQVEDFTTAPSTANIRPGNIIEYRITYTNVSLAPVGAGNRILAANSVVITEDGVVAPNNWALDQAPTNGAIDTSNVIGTASASRGTITYFPSGDQSGTTAAVDVTRYVNTLGVIVDPQASGEFTFRRRIN